MLGPFCVKVRAGLAIPRAPVWSRGKLRFPLVQGGGGGRKPNPIFFAGFFLSPGKGFAARVLPAFAGVVPMETKLREVGADAFNRGFREGNPNPFANYFGKGVLVRQPAAEHFEDFFNRQFSVVVAFRKIHVRFCGFLRGRLGGGGCGRSLRCRLVFAVSVVFAGFPTLLGSVLEL